MAKRILVVDDHDVVRQGVRLILRSRPEWEVAAEAVDGSEALEKIKQFTPDLVILDISMPRKSGLEVLADLEKSGKRLPIIVMTMHDSTELSAQVRKAGASGYVVKTHAGRDLLPAIEKVFDGGTFFPHDTVSSPSPDKQITRKPPGILRIIGLQFA
jgi:DNA-binding NarL/FixJ family response regulator